MSIPGAPAGARRVINWAYPSRMAFRRFCSDMMWLRRFCGVERSGFERVGEQTLASEFGVGGVLLGRSSWMWGVRRTDPVLVADRSLEDVDGSGVVFR